MRFVCRRDILNDAVGTVSKAAAVKSANSTLEGIKAEAKDGTLFLTAYDFNIAICSDIEATVIKEGVLIFPAKRFCDIIRKGSGEDVEIAADESGKITIVCGNSSFDIEGMPAADYPSLPKVDKKERVELTISAFRRLIKQTVYAAAQTEQRPILTGILFEIDDAQQCITAVGVDSARLALKRESYEKKTGGLEKFIVPAKYLNELLKILPEDSENSISISVSDKHAVFEYEQFRFLTRTLEGEFLNYKSVIPESCRFKVKVNTRELRSVFDRASLIAISEAIKSPIRCEFDYDRIKVSTASNKGRFSEFIEVENFGEKITVGFNNKLMLEALSACDSEKITIGLNSELTPLVLEPQEGNGFLSLVVPMRLNLDLM